MGLGLCRLVHPVDLVMWPVVLLALVKLSFDSEVVLVHNMDDKTLGHVAVPHFAEGFLAVIELGANVVHAMEVWCYLLETHSQNLNEPEIYAEKKLVPLPLVSSSYNAILI